MIRAIAYTIIAASLLLTAALPVRAQDARLDEVTSMNDVGPAQLKPEFIVFSDHRKDELVDPATGLMRFEDWARAKPLQKQYLSLYPAYVEPTIDTTVDGLAKSYVQKLSMYVVEARFMLPKVPESVDVSKYASIPFLASVDSTIKHQPITAADIIPSSNPDYAHNLNPARPWCGSAEQTVCIQSRYKFEGKLPAGIYLLNQLTEGKKHVDYLEFQSELRVVPQKDINQDDMKKLTGLNTPVVNVLEQNIFYINQVMDFGKFIAIVQQHPNDNTQTIVTSYIALAVKTKVLDRKKQFERVPVLRNLVPGQLLMGNSSFNTGTSLSAGLPSYTRNQILAIAGVMMRG